MKVYIVQNIDGGIVAVYGDKVEADKHKKCLAANSKFSDFRVWEFKVRKSADPDLRQAALAKLTFAERALLGLESELPIL